MYGITLIGVYNIAPEYLNTLNVFIKIYVSLFLIFFFNPLSKHVFTEFDKKIVFSAGILLLLTTTITDLIHPYINKQFYEIKNNIKDKRYLTH
jgi:hypothetical protein